MSIDYRALCAQLADELERCRPLAEVSDCLQRARAALAEPVVAPAWPTSQQLKTFACAWWKNFGFTKDKATCTWVIDEINPEHFVDFSWDLLARWGHKPAPADEGEVGVLLRELRDAAFDLNGSDPAKWMLTRAADLLEQRHPAPVPVSERLPGPEDCDAEGRCWLHLPDMGTEPLWRMTDPSMRSRYHSHWLPATALPLPAREVQP